MKLFIICCRLIHYIVRSKERKEEGVEGVEEGEEGDKTKNSMEGVLHKMVVVSSTSEADSAMLQVNRVGF